MKDTVVLVSDVSWLFFSIAPTPGSLERDVRFVYCACSISYILNDWSGLDIENTVKHITQLQVRRCMIDTGGNKD